MRGGLRSRNRDVLSNEVEFDRSKVTLVTTVYMNGGKCSHGLCEHSYTCANIVIYNSHL